jgi:hypothetical protein
MKKLTSYFTVIFFLCSCIASQAQTKQTTNNLPYNMLLCIDAEQMLNKAGFDNLLQQLFSPTSSIFRNDTEKATKLRKTFAAMYGAGIDLDKKIWMSFYSGKNDPKDSLLIALDSIKNINSRYPYAGYENWFSNFSYILHIPVGNRQVLEKCILDLASMDKSSEDAFSNWQKLDNISYLQKDEVVMAINDKVCIIAYKNFKLNSYQYEAPRKILKVDTVRNEYYKKPDTTTDKKNLIDPNYIVDKINANGEVVRVIPTVRKPIKKKYDYNVTEATKGYTIEKEVLVATDSTTAVAAPRATTQKSRKTTSKTKTTKSKKSNAAKRIEEKGLPEYEMPIPAPQVDTSYAAPYAIDTTNPISNEYEYEDTDTEYRDSITVYTKYKKRRLTPIEQDSIDAIFTNRNAKAAKVFLQQVFQKMEQPQLFDNIADTNVTKMLQNKNDISFYTDTEMYERYYGLTTLMYGVRNAIMPTSFNQGNYTSTFNSEPGKLVLHAITNFGEHAYNEMKDIYKPLNNNWPANFGIRSKAQFQTNVNVQALITYVKKIMSTEIQKGFNIETELAKHSLTEQEITNAFTGEIYAYVNTVANKKAYKRKEGREEIIGGLALRINNKEMAVALMNKLASIEKRKEIYEKYAFDKTGTYLIFIGADDDMLYAEDIAKQMNSGIDTETLAIQPNELIRIQVDVQGLTKALVGTNEKDKIYNYFINQIGSLYMSSLYSGKNGYINTIEMEAGKDGINPLAMMVEMLRMSNEQREEAYQERMREPKKPYIKPKAPVKKTNRATPKRK